MELEWSQLLTAGMTPEVAGVIMGVPAGIAELRLREAAGRQSQSARAAEAAARYLQSNFPTEEPRPRPRLPLAGRLD